MVSLPSVAPGYGVGLLAVLLSAVSGCAAGRAAEVRAAPLRPWLDAGPMLGHVSDEEARVWLRLAPGASLEVEARQDGVGARPVRVDDLGERCRLVVVSTLVPGRSVEVRLSDGGVDPVSLSVPAAPAPSATGTVRIAFGSCCKEQEFGGVAPVFDAMAAAGADVNLFLGDNCYYVRGDADPDRYFGTGGDVGEWSRADTMLARQLRTRRLPELGPVLRAAPCYATWDDHDYGPNNSDRTFEGRDRALAVFRQVWANPSYGTPDTPGVFCSFRRGPVEVFVMDGRFHRLSPDDGVPDEVACIWGDAQLRWLLDGLRASDAPVKVIANGSQVVNKGKAKDDNHWHEARREYYRLLDGLESVDGVVVFLSGDRHYSELMELDVPGRRPLMEFTSSPLQQGRALGPHTGDPNPTRLFAMDGNAFGLVTIEVEGPELGAITFECRDEAGRVPVLEGVEMKLRVPLGRLTLESGLTTR